MNIRQHGSPCTAMNMPVHVLVNVATYSYTRTHAHTHARARARTHTLQQPNTQTKLDTPASTDLIRMLGYPYEYLLVLSMLTRMLGYPYECLLVLTMLNFNTSKY